ncbi:MAG: TetR/AcrR family transcriptional regulator [Lachnospiraceae bacterium]|nr:TetR/AcrR family transcriptional regulator [Lachnospiraceae bacterium]
MKSKSYHHGDLRHSLIEMGIELIKQEGEESLSLRKVAAKCGVSNAAPYAHFKNKDEFLVAIQQHIMDLFTASLEKSFEEYENTNLLLPMLGKAYVMFFYQNPFYYDFLFSRKNISIKLSLDNSNNRDNPPLAILQKAAISIFHKSELPEKTIQDKIIAMWALVHGLSAIITMPNVEYDDNWELRVEQIIKSISIPYV